MDARASGCDVLPGHRGLDMVVANEPVHGSKGAPVQTGGAVEEAARGG